MRRNRKKQVMIMTEQKDSILMCLFVGFGYLFFCSLIPSLLSGVLSRWLPGDTNSYYALLSFGAGLLFLYELYTRFNEKVELGKNITLIGILEAILVGLLLFFVVNFLISPVLGSIFKSSEINYTESIQSMFETPIPTFFQLVVIAPLMEELIFRGFLLKRALRWRSEGMAVLIVAAVFGLFHLSIVQGLSAMAAGIILCLLYIWKQSVALCILAHSLFNGMAFVLVVVASRMM